MLKSLAYIASGGALGALSRYLVTLGMIRWMGGEYPWGTLAVNVLGSFVAGFFWGILGQTTGSHRTQALFFIGVLGAFTTFSTYALDSLNYAQSGQWGMAAGNVLANNVGALIAVGAGFALARVFVKQA